MFEHRRLPRLLMIVLSAQLALSSCSAVAHSPREPLWPDPKPEPMTPPHWPHARSTPNLQAPSATHCARPVSTREVPGLPPEQVRQHGVLRDDAAKSAREERHRDLASRGAAVAESAAPHPGPPAALAKPSTGAALQRMAPQDSMQPPPHPSSTVTAGVVDDNADFNAYLSFRQRTRVEHRPRDIRERYLLEVKDTRGRVVSDAEVAVHAPSGHAMWARTDAGGRAWLHPNAFDPSHASTYEVIVRSQGRQTSGRLTRGQKSSVEAVLDVRSAEARARLDLVFLIDATGSMADEIDKLKATLRTITAEVAQLPSRPDICLGLVAYRDRGDAFLTRTHDFTNDVGAVLQDALGPLRAGGGGDYPEAMNEALHETVHQLSWRGEGATRLVVLLADAPPHLDYGAPHYDDAMVAALGKGIKIFGVGASGLDRQGEFIQRQIAQYTGGRFVFLTYAQAHHPGRGPGRETVHDVKNYSVDTLDRLIVRLVSEELARRGGTGS
ncbi:VWA domain-containing protein [Caenimonas sedimenti]|uniref:VWA domain-containing protein n=1 Tax=Caenimonas sedimenti TaxID=2596921 RepID=A0A562ZH48_9BURK|nr:VWA domain-containing protein [Caenimonas sedimenti]TWO67843.1 VWA domain-containing protein [Caenimonas sedimenti]